MITECASTKCRDLLKRQHKHVLVTNERLFSMHQKNDCRERAKFDIEPDTAAVKDIRQAAAHLSLVCFERYKKFQGRSTKYSSSVVVNSLNLTQTVSVQSLRHPDAPKESSCQQMIDASA